MCKAALRLCIREVCWMMPTYTFGSALNLEALYPEVGTKSMSLAPPRLRAALSTVRSTR